MSLGILRKYNQHGRVSTEIIDQDTDVVDFNSGGHTLTYLGEQTIPTFIFRNVTNVVDKVYNQNYTPLNAIMHLRKFNVVINSHGITVIQPATKKFAAKLILQYHVKDLLFITTDWKHHKALAIVLRSSPTSAALHLYLCISREQANTIVEECFDEFKDVKEVKYSSHPVSLQIVQNNDDENHVVSNIVLDDSSNKEEKLANRDRLDDSMEFGGFQSSEPSLVSFDSDDPAAMPEATLKPSSPDQRFDVEDEFALFALKRNKNMPDHMQDKSIESGLLMPEGV